MYPGKGLRRLLRWKNDLFDLVDMSYGRVAAEKPVRTKIPVM